MSTSRHINKICVAAVVLSLALTLLFMDAASLCVVSADRTMGYENKLFDNSIVHTVDIVMDDWDGFIETCENEEYSPCAVVIDGESYKNIGIRAKGNTSLSSVRTLGSQRYSFKLEFDQYENGKSYHGLDKLSLNNLIQDNTMMKDCLVYQMMVDYGVDAPLCSYVYITVNGEDWGLYLAVEGVEDSFLQRNYGSDSGELYKPDSMSFGGGRGNGENFNFDNLDFDFGNTGSGSPSQDSPDSGDGSAAAGRDTDGGQAQTPGNGAFPGGGFPASSDGSTPQGGDMPSDGSTPQGGFTMPPDGSVPQGGDMPPDGSVPQGGDMPSDGNTPSDGGTPQMPEGFGGFFGGGFGGMGSDDVKLKYIDDNSDSYSNIFGNAKTEITKADKQRLIAALKNLNEYTDLENTLDIEEVLRYFVVHNFVCNGDSYTGAMIHNYYLHEQDGKLSMIPWDYNLAFGTFQAGDAGSSVNASIDSPVSGGNVDDRPMVGWIFSDESYTQEYHQLFSDFINRWFSDGQLVQMIEETQALLKPFVEKDPTKFCTVEEFETGVQTLEKFVTLRAEAVSRQLSGDTSQVDATGLNTSDMGSMGGTMGRGFGGGNGGDSKEGIPGFGSGNPPQPGGAANAPDDGSAEDTAAGDGGRPPFGGDGNFPQMGGQNSGASTVSGMILICVSMGVLLIGLFVAVRTRC